MNNWQIALLTGVAVLFIASIAVYIFLNIYVVEKQYRKFYPAPVMPLFLSMKNNERFKKVELILITILYSIIYIPLTVVWVLVWCVYKFVKWSVKGYIEITDQTQPEISEKKEYTIPEVEVVKETPVWEEKPEDL